MPTKIKNTSKQKENSFLFFLKIKINLFLLKSIETSFICPNVMKPA
jgi:hypothetical protein